MTLIWFLLVLGVLVFVHEFGHFLMAKLYGVYVDRFSLGLGPRLFGVTLGETDYCISAIPFGGYVRMAGQFDVPEEYDKEAAERYKDVPTARWFNRQSVSRRMAIIVAGPLMNLLFALPVAFVMLTTGINQPLALDATTIGYVVPGSPAAVAGLVPGDVVRAIDGRPVPAWDEMVRAVRRKIGEQITVVIVRDGEEITVRATPGVDEEIGYLGIGIEQMQRGMVSSVDADGPAAQSELQLGDVVDRIVGVSSSELSLYALIDTIQDNPGRRLVCEVKRFPRVRGVEESNEYTTARVEVQSERVGRIEHADVGQLGGRMVLVPKENAPSDFPVRAGDRVLAIDGRNVGDQDLLELIYDLPAGEVDVTVTRVEGRIRKHRITTNLVLRVTDMGRIGVEFTEAQQRVVYSPVQALVLSPVRCYHVFLDTLDILRMMVERKVSIKGIAGPLTIARMTGAAARTGWDVLLGLVLLITVNLGILNLLPLPVLDGGHVVLLCIEGVIRRPLPTAFVLWFQKAGVFLLLALFAVVMYQDIIRLIVANESLGLLIGRVFDIFSL
jgi:regulator of sigma E protease